MKILFFVRLYYPHVGGIEKHLEKVCERLLDRGYEITITTTKYDSRLPDKEEYKGVKIIRFEQPNIKFLGLINTWYWLFKNINLLKQSDVIHIHDVFNWYWPFRILFPSKKVYLTIHGRWGAYPIPFKDTVQKKITARFSHGLLAIGEYITKNYGIEADILSYGATNVPKKSITKEERSIVYVGRMDKDIALSKSFKVFKKLDEYNIDFCGDGKLKKEAKKYGKVHGFIDPDPYYEKAKYCFASGYLTILEALAHKCLVFTLYDHPLQEDYYKLTPFRDFIITSDDPDYIFQKLRYYEDNPKEMNDKIEKGHKWVKNQTWDKMINNYLSLWNIN